MFMCISQLENMPKEDLLCLCPSMPAGTAPLVLGYARKDYDVILEEGYAKALPGKA
jgi:hypothetical protein